MTEWAQFAEALAEQLAQLPIGAIMKIIAVGPTGRFRFVQFAIGDDALVAELTGDAYLDSIGRPTPEGRLRIIDAGWQLPDADHVDNWWIELPWPISSAVRHQLAAMVITGLRDGFDIPDPASLVYDAWNSNDGNKSLILPSLSLTGIDAT
ncbi:hypothetical protein OG203_05350 [Nocardia sp. NBC_01499]|uniref:TY-Chap domain-containing protein n=1 Tax=Nocardia sp. NBC_01499 TaxID=2903597 RepID=UPI003863DB76